MVNKQTKENIKTTIGLIIITILLVLGAGLYIKKTPKCPICNPACSEGFCHCAELGYQCECGCCG